MVHILKRLATYSRRIDTSRLLRTTSRRPKRPAAIHVAVANEYFAEKLREKDNIDIELNDIMKRISPHFEIIDTKTNALVSLVSRENPEALAMVRVKFHCQNSEEIGVDENVMAKRITKSLKHESTAKETNSNGKFSVSGSLDNTTDTDVGIHFVVTITPTDSAMSAIVLDCFASENLRVLRMRGLDDSMIEGWVGRIEGEAGPLSPVAPKRRKDLPPLVVKPSLVYMFSTLKVETQKLILSFLKQLRIDDDLSFFVLCYGRTKEQEQYLQFLEQLVHFTDQGINIAALGLTSKQSPKKQWK